MVLSSKNRHLNHQKLECLFAMVLNTVLWYFGFKLVWLVMCSYQDLDAPEDEVTVIDYRSLWTDFANPVLESAHTIHKVVDLLLSSEDGYIHLWDIKPATKNKVCISVLGGQEDEVEIKMNMKWIFWNQIFQTLLFRQGKIKCLCFLIMADGFLSFSFGMWGWVIPLSLGRLWVCMID